MKDGTSKMTYLRIKNKNEQSKNKNERSKNKNERSESFFTPHVQYV
jgi:hypothetical protein